MVRRKWTVGVDFGGTNVKLGLVTDAGRVVGTERFSSKGFNGPGRFIDGVSLAIETLARSAGVTPAQLRGVGVGAPGPVDVEDGVVHSLVNVPGWRRVPLRRLLERRLRCRCAVENDANLFLLGEWHVGAAQGIRQAVGVTLGTGVGGALLINGELYRGTSGAAGEIGHMVVHPYGRRCGCGARGCLEAQVGTAAIVEMGRGALRRNTGGLRALFRKSQGPLTPALISEAAARGDPAARQIWADVGRWLGLGLGSVVNLLNPERIVIGGGVAHAWGWFYPGLIRALRAQAQRVAASAVRVVRGRLGEEAGIVGAAVSVWSGDR